MLAVPASAAGVGGLHAGDVVPAVRRPVRRRRQRRRARQHHRRRRHRHHRLFHFNHPFFFVPLGYLFDDSQYRPRMCQNCVETKIFPKKFFGRGTPRLRAVFLASFVL